MPLSPIVLKKSTTVVFMPLWELTTGEKSQFYDPQPHMNQVLHTTLKKLISRACHHLQSSQGNNENSFELS